jgi:hypothetical protein
MILESLREGDSPRKGDSPILLRGLRKIGTVAGRFVEYEQNAAILKKTQE